MPKPYWKRENWNNRGFNRNNRHPSHLKGKDIGLFYRDRYKNSGCKTNMKEVQINLKIPPTVVTKINTNLQNIAKIATKLNINITKPNKFKLKNEQEATSTADINDDYEIMSESEEESDFSTCETDGTFKKPNLPNVQFTKDICEAKPGMSGQYSEPMKRMPDVAAINDTALDYIPFGKEIKTEPILINTCTDLKLKNKGPDCVPSKSTPDFIPISTSEPDYSTSEKDLNLRGSGDYKYSYEDIITGTFDEKLEESIAKGITINKCTDDIAQLNRDYYEDFRNMCNKRGYKEFLKVRQILPTYKNSQDIVNIVQNNQVTVISGETGCGKSTQVPQIILDDALNSKKGANIKILVTQPRRIAASALAARVAQERGEKMGSSVGYAVRLERIDARPRGSITYCTTGILLADLEVNQGLTNYSHIILDEVHERDCHIDLSMCMLKKVLEKRKDLKLILMSATIDAEKLSDYFGGCPLMHIEGLAYPVQDVFLEDILHMTKFKLEDMPPPSHQARWQGYKRGHENAKEKLAMEYKVEVGPWLTSIKSSIDREVFQTLQDNRIEMLNIDLIYQLIYYICRQPPGAILVFLPGIGEITKLIKTMEMSGNFPSSRYEIYPLHSKLPSLDQQRIFERPPENIRKIIIATNIAETSITIDDIVYVVDCAKMKITGLNVEDNISTLKVEWVSQANMHQRRGRAGRCQAGICYHLLTSYRASKIPERALPELQRSNLLEPVLTIKRLRLGKAAEALASVPSPPDESTVKCAVKHLQQCGALDSEETLTPLGWHLARLPVHPSAGKLLLLGSLFGCLDRAASVAAVWGFKDPFHLVIGKEYQVDMARRRLAIGEPSDHVAISEAIIQWESCPHSIRKSFAYENFLSHNTLQLLSDMKRQLGDGLKQMGFLASGNIKAGWENRNTNNLSLFKAIVAASLYPNFGTVRWLHHKARKNKQIRVIAYTPSHGRVAIHPSSVMTVSNSHKGPPIPLCSNPGANWLVYWLKQRTSDLFLFDVTLVFTLPLLFFGEVDVSGVTDPIAKKPRFMRAERCQEEWWTQTLEDLKGKKYKALKLWKAAKKTPEEDAVRDSYKTVEAAFNQERKATVFLWKLRRNAEFTKDIQADECVISLMSTVKVQCRKETADMLFQLRALLDQVLASKVMASSNHATKHCEFEECVLNTVIELITAEDEQVDYVDGGYTDSEHSDVDSQPSHSRYR